MAKSTRAALLIVLADLLSPGTRHHTHRISTPRPMKIAWMSWCRFMRILSGWRPGWNGPRRSNDADQRAGFSPQNRTDGGPTW